MDADRLRKITRLYQVARAWAFDEQQLFLETACERDAALRQAVESLLSGETRAEVFNIEHTISSSAETSATSSQPVAAIPDPGRTLGRYRIERLLGRGGMGAVFLAYDPTLQRQVAVKVIDSPAGRDTSHVRLLREARSAAGLSHPNICTIYEVASANGAAFIAMEYVQGRPLSDRLHDGALPLAEAVRYGIEAVDALAFAHDHGVVHHDFKAANAIITPDGRLKIVDFGLARRDQIPTGLGTTPRSNEAARGVAGTPYAMAPEQVRGDATDAHTDIWAVGVLLYQMVSGAMPFQAPTIPALFLAILRDPPAPLPDAVPRDLQRLITQCLEKNPIARGTARELRERLTAIERWAETEALPEITRLIDAGSIYQAYRLAQQAARYRPGDLRLQRLVQRITLPITVVTEPAGAQVFVNGYMTPEEPYQLLGETPLHQVPVPYALMRWRIVKEGFETFEGAPFGGPSLGALAFLRLEPIGSRITGMVRVPGGPFVRPGLPPVQVSAYWLDRFEVTNREYRAFVSAGAYHTREYWKEPFLDGTRELTWEEAMSRFRDRTGQPGPATWEAGTYPEGQADYPVGGISWYEAAAYCVYVGKRLPTVFHWFKALGHEQLSDMLQRSNFGDGPVSVGSLKGVGPFGTYDMAGNVKEWTWNASVGYRCILGGGWGEATYSVAHLDARPPFDRAATNGVRCARYDDPAPETLADIPVSTPDLLHAQPVAEAIFEAYRRLYSYDRSELHAAVQAVDDESAHWRKEVVSFDAAYGGERVTALLFLPRDVAPPYQVVTWFPGDDVFFLQSSDRLASEFLFDFIPRSGRALVYPIYKGMYERRIPMRPHPAIRLVLGQLEWAPNEWRDLMIQCSKDLGRTIDYLETRADLDVRRLAYYGFSSGAWYGPIFQAVDPRFAASVLVSAGICVFDAAKQVFLPPEMSVHNFASRSTVPTLMINGRDDLIYSVQSSQQPLFDLLGAPVDQKRHVMLDGGHIPADRPGMMQEILGWLDRFLGPVGAPAPVGVKPANTAMEPTAPA